MGARAADCIVSGSGAESASGLGLDRGVAACAKGDCRPAARRWHAADRLERCGPELNLNMMQREIPRRYGVIEQATSNTDVELACESIRHLGYGTIDGGYASGWLRSLSDAFERARDRYHSEHGGPDALRAIDEHNTIRLPLALEPMFLELAANDKILEICSRLIPGYVVLNQQNGIINPPRSE